MSGESDDFVEALLKGLSKAEPISEFEIHKFEKLIDNQTEEFKKTKQIKKIRVPVSIAASIAIAFGAAFVLTNHSAVIKNNNGISQQISPQPTVTAGENSGATKSTTKPSAPQATGGPSNSQSSGGSTEIFGNTNSSSGANGTVAKFETNLDYATALPSIRKLVSIGIKPGSLGSLDRVSQQCAIKLGVSTSLLAFDRAYYQGQRVSAYYSGSNNREYKIILVNSECALISEL